MQTSAAGRVNAASASATPLAAGRFRSNSQIAPVISSMNSGSLRTSQTAAMKKGLSAAMSPAIQEGLANSVAISTTVVASQSASATLIITTRSGWPTVTAAMKNGNPGARKNGRLPVAGYACVVQSALAVSM